MTARLIECRNAVLAQIVADGPSYAIQDFSAEATYIPQETLKSLAEKPAVKVIGKGFDQDRIVRSSTKTQLELPVEVAVQKQVDLSAATLTNELDNLVLLTQQIMDTVASDTLSDKFIFTWLRTEAARDDNDLPYSYDQLRQESVFQAIFTAYYSHIKQ